MATSKKARGQVLDHETDRAYGRHWITRGEKSQPVLYSRIGAPVRAQNRHTRIVYNFIQGWGNKSLLREKYRKRWPSPARLGFAFFAEFCLRDTSLRTLCELARTLPFYGVGCSFYQKDPTHQFVLKAIDWKTVPFDATLRGDWVKGGKIIRKNIAPPPLNDANWSVRWPELATKFPQQYRPPFPKIPMIKEADS